MIGLTTRLQRAARELAGMNQKQLSEASGVPLPTIRAFESGQTQRMMAANERLIVQTLEGAGVVFLPENGNGPGIAMRKADGHDSVNRLHEIYAASQRSGDIEDVTDRIEDLKETRDGRNIYSTRADVDTTND